MDSTDRAIILATQEGLPIDPQPYHRVAEAVGIEPVEVMERMQRMLESGVIRRIGAVPNHYRLGYRGNGMSVWNVPDEKVAEIGERLGALDFVSHCYQRPTYPDWPYSIFTMVHGKTREQCEAALAAIAAIADETGVRDYTALYSTHEYKKVRVKYFTPENAASEREHLEPSRSVA